MQSGDPFLRKMVGVVLLRPVMASSPSAGWATIMFPQSSCGSSAVSPLGCSP